MKYIKQAIAIPLMAIVVVFWLANLVTGTIADIIAAAVDSLLND